ncbi:MAG: hypothetical protein NTY60_11820 [Proteobacteria bacterium]|nr:hypothetical protein [Pseudomonadota bacterium]
MQIKGVNLLQSHNVALDDLKNVGNMQHLKELGANTVAFVPFIRQTASCEMTLDEHYSITRLHRAIDYAHQAGLHVVLKPQILIQGSWAGDIDQASEQGWSCWFSAYTGQMLELAKLAGDSQTEMLVIGTELHKTENRPEWRALADAVHRIYHGQLSYVAHDIGDLASFSALDKLDSVAVTYYPRLEQGDMRKQMKQLAGQVRMEAAKLKKPFWIAEIGITSRAGALENPWLWPDQFEKNALTDPALQAQVLDGWLAELAGDWHKGILIWNWYSDANAGGMTDLDFTIQNKPATEAVSSHWKQH